MAEGKTALLFGLGKAPLVLPDGTTWDLADAAVWTDAVSTLAEQVRVTRPPLLWMHDLSSEEVGRVIEAIEVSGDVLRARGIDPDVADLDAYLLFRATLNERGRRMEADGTIRATSVGMGRDVTDERGRTWSWFLGELSVVTTPHVTRQPHADELASVGLRSAADAFVTLSAVHALVREKEAGMTEEEKKEMAELRERLEAALAEAAELRSRLDATEEEKEEMRAAAEEGEALAAIDRARVALSDAQRKRMVGLYRTDRDAFADLLSGFPRIGDNRRAASPPAQGGRKTWAEMSANERMVAVSELAAERKITPMAASDLARRLFRDGGVR